MLFRSAWSTLGFFSDPVFSSMLQKQKGELAELIFHELFHGTIYVSGQVDLNENLAEFIAEKATLVFFNSDKTNLSDYKMHKAKQNEISYFATSCLERLRQVYRSMEERKLSKRDKMQIKDSLYRVFESEIGANETMEHLQRRKILNRMQSGKNAFFMHFNRYEGLRDSLETVFRVRHGGSLPDLIKSHKITCKSF